MCRARYVYLLVAVAICAAPASADARHATPVSCGDVITRDTRVANDLADCPGDGLVIGAPGIRLDLRGHTIDGDATPAGDDEVDVGIDNGAGHDGVTIENGAIQEFDVGVSLPEVSGNRVNRLRVSDNEFLGLDLDFSEHSVIEDSSFSGNGTSFDGPGLFVLASHYNRIEGNLVAGNVHGLVQLASHDNEIEGNSFVANSDEGLFLGDSSADNRVTRNLVARNAFAGIVVEADGNAVSRNRVAANGDNVIVVGSGNVVARNDVVDALGCPDGCGLGISLEGGTGNVIADNNVVGSRDAGVRVASFPPDTPETSHNAVLRNVVVRAGTDGILVESSATDTVLNGNVARRAADDGIDVDSPDATLSRNLALHNGDLGIEAVTGVTDRGSNRARGNGDPAQCTGVVCRW